MNVNRVGDYNYGHVHTDSFLSGVYYADPGVSGSSAAPHGGGGGGGELVLSDVSGRFQSPLPFSFHTVYVWRLLQGRCFVCSPACNCNRTSTWAGTEWERTTASR